MGKRGKTGEHLAGRHGPQGNGWKGGRTITRGYIAVWFPDSPMADKRGYVLEHRLVMSVFIGRLLTRKDVIHHINGDKTDNNIENLYLTNRQEHISLHLPVQHTVVFTRFTTDLVCSGCGITFRPKRNMRGKRAFHSKECWSKNHKRS